MRTRTNRITLVASVLGAGLLTATLVAGTANASTPAATASAPAASASTPAPAASTSTAPPLAEQDAAGDHSMGSSIRAHAAQAGSASGTKMLTAPQAATSAAAGGPPPGRVQGMDVSAWQHDVDFHAAHAKGARFAYVKATEGTSYTSPRYQEQYAASYKAGMIRGGYAYAQPSQASGNATAEYFFAHGGGWSPDGHTLPPLLDIEYGSAAQGTCYGFSQAAMRTWISEFSNTVYAHIHRWPAIYTTTDWWVRCTGNSSTFQGNPLFVALYPVNDFTTPGALGASWRQYTFWQWAAAGTFPGDQDVYRNDLASLRPFSLRMD